jgi:hypothetical protein
MDPLSKQQREFLERVNKMISPVQRWDLTREAKLLQLQPLADALSEFHNQLGDLDAKLTREDGKG